MDGHTNSEQKDDEVPEDVDVSVLVSQLRARVNTLERENQQVKEHTKQQSRQIQIMKQQEEGIEIHKGDIESLKEVCRGLEEEKKRLTKQLKIKSQEISSLEEDLETYQKTANEMFRDLAAEKKVLMVENEQLKSENSNLKTQLETEQAKSMTYKLDFDDERKDREKAHSQYADLEKEMAELKNVTRALASTDVTKDVELVDVLKLSSLGGGDERDRQLEEWRKEALQSREELQSKTSQVKAYKKQVDQYKEKLELAEKQGSKGLLEKITDLTLEKQHLENYSSDLAEQVVLLNVKINGIEPLLRTEIKSKVKGEVDTAHASNDDDENEAPLRARDPSAASRHPPNYFPPPEAINPPPGIRDPPLVHYGPPHSDRDLQSEQFQHPPLTFHPTMPSREYNDQVYSDGQSTRSDNPTFHTDYSDTVHRQPARDYHLPQNQPPPSNYGNQQSYPIQQQFEQPFRSNPVPPPQQHDYDRRMNEPHSQPNQQQQYYPHDQYSELEKTYPQLAGNFETNSQYQNQPLPQDSNSHNDTLESNQSTFDNVPQSDIISTQPSSPETNAPPRSVPSQASEASDIPNPQVIEQLNPNRTELLVKPNVLQEGIDGEINEAAAAVSHVTMEGEREGAPLDPNLICPMCMKQYRIGEIQLYRAHVNKCDGNKQ